eukprot:jgi/Botrbrau1/12295/Bobra.27_5s0006.1
MLVFAAGISPVPLMVASTGTGEDSNRFVPLGDSVSRDNMLFGDVIGQPHHHGRDGISEVDAHELRAAASQLGTLFEGAMGHACPIAYAGLQTSSHIPPCPPLPILMGNSSSTLRLSRRRLMNNKRGYPFPKVRILLARKAPPARIARGAMGKQAPPWPLPASLLGDTFTTSAPSSTTCAAGRLSKRPLMDNNSGSTSGRPFPIVRVPRARKPPRVRNARPPRQQRPWFYLSRSLTFPSAAIIVSS